MIDWITYQKLLDNSIKYKGDLYFNIASLPLISTKKKYIPSITLVVASKYTQYYSVKDFLMLAKQYGKYRYDEVEQMISTIDKIAHT